MAKTQPPQPGTRGTSPSPNIDRASKTSWDSWHQHGNKTPGEAIANDKNVIRKPVNPGKK